MSITNLLPNWRTWVITLWLLLLNIPLVLVFRTVGRIVVGFLINMKPNDPEVAIICLLWGILFLGYILPVLTFAHLHQFFFGDPIPGFPKWIPAPKSLTEGVYQWTVWLLSMNFTFSLALLLFTDDLKSSELTDTQSLWLFVIWFFSALYLNHFRYLIEQRCQQPETKQPTKTNSSKQL